jgi:hypothetical protein
VLSRTGRGAGTTDRSAQKKKAGAGAVASRSTFGRQAIAAIANPRGGFFLTRDAENIGRWFGHHGLAGVHPEPADLAALLCREARLD